MYRSFDFPLKQKNTNKLLKIQTFETSEYSIEIEIHLFFLWQSKIKLLVCSELEMVMMDWLGKMLELPEEFLFSGPGRGGGVIQVRSY